MAMIQTRILKKPGEVKAELIRLDLRLEGLLKVRTMALGAGADATPFHAANAAGTFSYHYGIYGLRDEFVGDVWDVDRPDGIEVIRNVSKNVLIGFANVDIACNDDHWPIPRTKKGSGAERVSQTTLFDSLPSYVPVPTGLRALYYLMTAMNGAVELSRPIVKDGDFFGFIDRIYLSNGDDFDRMTTSFDEGDLPATFDPQVLRKV